MSVPTSPNPIYIKSVQSRRGCVQLTAWKAALAEVAATPSSSAPQARRAFDNVREAYWPHRLRLAVPGEFNDYNKARMSDGKPPIGPDGFPIELEHREELSKNPLRALDPTNIFELFRRQHDFQHGNYGFRWHAGSLPVSPHAKNLNKEFGDPLQHKLWP
jgi:hypothetical protein